MRWSKLLPLALAVALVACAPRHLTQQQRAVEEQVLQGRVQLWEQAMNTLKPDSMGMLYEQSPGFSEAWPDGQLTRGWDQQEQALKDFAARTKSFNFDVQDPVIDILTPAVAVVTFRHASDVADSVSARALYSGLGTMVWVKDPSDKVWKIHTLEMSRNPVAQPAGRRR
jgi:hypothetical protein